MKCRLLVFLPKVSKRGAKSVTENLPSLHSNEVLKTIEIQSNESISFNDFINQINDNFSQDQKLEMISFLWHTAYADNVLDVDEERLIRRIADMIRIKDMQVLKLKHKAKQK